MDWWRGLVWAVLWVGVGGIVSRLEIVCWGCYVPGFAAFVRGWYNITSGWVCRRLNLAVLDVLLVLDLPGLGFLGCCLRGWAVYVVFPGLGCVCCASWVGRFRGGFGFGGGWWCGGFWVFDAWVLDLVVVWSFECWGFLGWVLVGWLYCVPGFAIFVWG